jgi:hypothetical protein
MQLLNISDLKNKKYKKLVVAAPGDVSRAIELVFQGKQLIGTYTIDTQPIDTPSPHMHRLPPTVDVKLYEVDASTVVATSTDMPSHLYSMISTEIHKAVSPASSFVVSSASGDFETGEVGYSKLSTTAVGQKDNIGSTMLTGFCASYMTLVLLSHTGRD